MKTEEIILFTFQTIGSSVEFRPTVTLQGSEELEGKDTKKLYDLMNQIKLECLNLKVHFESKVYTVKTGPIELSDWEIVGPDNIVLARGRAYKSRDGSIKPAFIHHEGDRKIYYAPRGDQFQG